MPERVTIGLNCYLRVNVCVCVCVSTVCVCLRSHESYVFICCARYMINEQKQDVG